MNRVTKLFQTKIKSIDEEKRQVTFCFSDNQVDRMGEIVDQSTWDTKSYDTNPLILWGHDPSEPENVLGSGISLDLNKGGKSFVTAQFDDDDTNPKAGLVFRQLLKGTLRCVSAGFIPHTIDTEEDTPVLKDNELLEISIVPIPANPRAVALSLKEGSISRKDAEWLMKSMRDEAEALDGQLKALATNEKEKKMTDETAKALIDSVKKLTEEFGTFKEATETSIKSLTDTVETLKPAEETEEEKTARQAAEAEAARKAAEENDDDPAKGGEDDQPGAGEAQFDEDAELTPELQAEIDAALADEALMATAE